MRSERAATPSGSGDGPDSFDGGLLSPATSAAAEEAGDAAVLRALVDAELGLARAVARSGSMPGTALDSIERALEGFRGDPAQIARDSAGGGNPVIPLLAELRRLIGAADPEAAAWLHRGATSQDILDTALALVAHRASAATDLRLARVADALAVLAEEHRGTLAVARTLGQHSVPTTFGLRVAGWLGGVLAARSALSRSRDRLPAQLGGASGTLASFVELFGAETAETLPARYAAELGLAAPRAPWHTSRAPFTRLADSTVEVVDALAVIAGDVALLSRTEVGEVSEGREHGRGVSSAMPQKRNPVLSVLIRSAALRAPGLAADLHRAFSLATDERPDGAWHSEWPALRELQRLGLGASARGVELAEGLEVHPERMRQNLSLTGPLIVSERVMIRLAPVLGRARVSELVELSLGGADLAGLLSDELSRTGASGPSDRVDLDGLLDAAQYTGLADELIDRTLEDYRAQGGT